MGEASAAVFVLPLQSTWLKFSFGDGDQVRLPGDVGVEAYFSDQTTLKISNAQAISYTGLGTPGAGDKVPAGTPGTSLASRPAATTATPARPA